MSYELDDESSEINDIKKKARELEDQLFDLVTIGTENDGPPVSPTIGKVREVDNTLGGTLKKTELGDVKDTINISFTEYDERRIFGNVIGDLNLTFTEIPIPLLLALRLYIRVTNPTIIIAGTTIDETTAIDDFLDLQLESTDGINITVTSVKKNDESAGDVAPTFARNIESFDHTNSQISIRWDAPGIGSLPIVYDAFYSLSPAENGDGSPQTPITDASLLNLDATEATAKNLAPGTTYYFWINAKNDTGSSGFVGPLQTITDGSYTAGDIQFKLIAIDYETIRASWTQPAGKQLRFSLIRNLGANVFETVVNNNTPVAGETRSYDDENLDPNTLYNYVFQVRNEFGNLISTITTGATTPDLPKPVLSIDVQGRKLKFTVTIISGINLCDIQWDIVNTFNSRVATTTVTKTVSPDTEQIIQELTPDLNQSTVYFVRARFRKNQFNGPYNDSQSKITGTVPTPQRPRLTLTSPSSGKVRIKLRFENDTSVNESAILTWRDEGSATDEYVDFPQNVLDRDFPPADDLDERENRIEVIRSGGWNPGDFITIRAVCTNLTGTSIADTENILVAN